MSKDEFITEGELVDEILSHKNSLPLRYIPLALECSTSYIYDVIAGRKPPGPKLISALGYEKVVRYKKVSEVNFEHFKADSKSKTVEVQK